MREQFRKRCGPFNRDREVRALAPFRKLFVQRMPSRVDRVAEWFEHPVKERLVTSYGKNIDASGQRDWSCHQFRLLLAVAAEGRAVHLRDGNTHERRRHIGPIVNVVPQQESSVPAFPACHPHRVHVE